MYNLSFDRMVKMFEGERTQKQLKNKFEKEMRDHPDMVHRALRTQITKGPWAKGLGGNPFFSCSCGVAGFLGVSFSVVFRARVFFGFFSISCFLVFLQSC